MTTEEWRRITWADGIYEVSSQGRVRHVNLQTGVVRLINGFASDRGYRRVSLLVNGKTQKVFIHRLIAEAFIGPIQDGLEVNHIDGNKQNNARDNLEIVTRSANMKHAFAHGFVVMPDYRNNPAFDAMAHAKLTREDVVKMRAEYATKQYTFAQLGRIYGVCKSAARRAILGLSWQSI